MYLFYFCTLQHFFPVSPAWSGLWNLMDLWSSMNIIMFVKISFQHITINIPKLLKINDPLCSEMLIRDNNLELSIWYIVRGYMNGVRNDLAFYRNKNLSRMECVLPLRCCSNLVHQNIIEYKFYVIKFYLFLFLSEFLMRSYIRPSSFLILTGLFDFEHSIQWLYF